MVHELIKKNSQFDYAEKLKDFSINLGFREYQALWEMVSGSSNEVAAILYERIANYVQNIRDIELCGLDQLYSLAKEMDVDQAFSYDINYPNDLANLMDILSVDRSHLLTSGYMLENSCLSAIYADQSLSDAVTAILPQRFSGFGAVSGVWVETTGVISAPGPAGVIVGKRVDLFNGSQVRNLSSNVYIPDNAYLTGFLEGTLSAFLTEKLSHQSPNYGYLIEITGLSPSAENLRRMYLESLEYQDFLINIYSNPALSWNPDISGAVVEEGVHTLRNIAIRASYQRETLKQVAKKYAMIGTANAIQKIFEEYVLRSFTKKTDWRLFVETDPSKLVTSELSAAAMMESWLPSLSAVNPYFDIKVIEYWDTTEYMNVSAASAPNIVVTGYVYADVLTSQIDVSGNLLTGYVTSAVPSYGPVGLIVSGGNPRYWEGDYIRDSILNSETTSAEVSAFYYRLGLTGGLDQVFGIVPSQDLATDSTLYTGVLSRIWDTFAVSGFNRFAVIPDLTGTLRPEWQNVTGTLPDSAWLVAPTHLSGIHFKYIGNVSGDAVPNNYKNTIYPTIATQPVVWNLVEKAFDEFPSIVHTVLLSEQAENELSAHMVDSVGNIIDSWRYYNHEYVGYQTYYEESANQDYSGGMNPAVDRDGPFDPTALSAFIVMTDNLTGNMTKYYGHIADGFAYSADNNFPCIDYQLSAFHSGIRDLSGVGIYQYSFDHYDNHYALYKSSDDFESQGRVWMRYRNHPLSFPLCVSPRSSDVSAVSAISAGMAARLPGLESDVVYRHALQQMYCRLDELENIFDGKCNDFGFFSNICWAVGEGISSMMVPSGSGYVEVSGNVGALYVFTPDFVAFDAPVSARRFAIRVDDQATILRREFVTPNNFVGGYIANEDIAFVVFNGWRNGVDGYIADFKFYWYDIYGYDFADRPTDTISISGLPTPLPMLSGGNVQQWKLQASEDILTMCYESLNPAFSAGDPQLNNIVSVMTNKLAPSDLPGEHKIMVFGNFVGGIEE